jgi:hypothetical protein
MPGGVGRFCCILWAMGRLKNFRDVLAMYRKHGWRLARVLACAETLEEMRASAGDDARHVGSVEAARGEPGEEAGDASGALTFEGVPAVESETDAMWFTRPAQGGREAWELRLVGETPYALFELFESDEAEEDREDVRREMEARLREHAAPRAGEGGQI